MKVLFVCRGNHNRSPRAAEVFQNLARERGFDVEVLSAGTQTLKIIESAIQLTNEMLERSDIVVALDSFVKGDIERYYQAKPKRMIDLEIGDRYSQSRGNIDALYKALNRKLEPLVEELSLLQGKRLSKEVL
jgi:protein-tyrosine-phosphatase